MRAATLPVSADHSCGASRGETEGGRSAIQTRHKKHTRDDLTSAPLNVTQPICFPRKGNQGTARYQNRGVRGGGGEKAAAIHNHQIVDPVGMILCVTGEARRILQITRTSTGNQGMTLPPPHKPRLRQRRSACLLSYLEAPHKRWSRRQRVLASAHIPSTCHRIPTGRVQLAASPVSATHVGTTERGSGRAC